MVSRVGVVGHPVGHSLSPHLHGRWLEAHGIDARYEAIDGEAEGGFATFFRDRLPDYLGVNVTLPYKAEALALADEVSDRAASIGTANLLTRREDGTVHADNTDGIGFATAIEPLLERRGHARILGAGGAAPAIAWALADHRFARIEIANRTADKATAIADRFGLETLSWDRRADALTGVDLLVNTTSLGLPGAPPLDIDVAGLPDHALVIDIVTDPDGTPLLRAARDRGLRTQTGLPMLVHQAIPSFAAWFGVTPTDAHEAVAFLEGAS